MKLSVKNGEETVVTEHKFTYNLVVKTATATTATVNTTGSQTLGFSINDNESVSIDYLKNNGWAVEFQATKGVFTGGAVISATGELAASLHATNDDFTYKVVLTKGDTVIESSTVKVDVVDKAGTFTDITNYTLRLDKGTSGIDNVTDAASDPILSSNKLVVNDNAVITDLKGTTLSGVKDQVVSGASYTSSTPAVATVNSSGVIVAQSTGTTEITITKGEVTEKFTITVVADARKATTGTLSESSVKLVSGQTSKVLTGQVKDQYGDPYFINYTDADLTVSRAVNSTNDEIAATIKPVGQDSNGVVTDKDGKFSFGVQASADKVGSGKIEVKRVSDNKVLATLNVTVSNDQVATSHKLELSSGSDLTLDKYNNANPVDDTLTLKYNGYNADGFLVGAENVLNNKTAGVFSVESSNTNVITVDETEDKNIVVTAKAAGTASINIYKGAVKVDTVTITVKDTTPSISSLVLKDAKAITTLAADSGNEFDLTKVFSVDSNNKVADLVVSGTTADVLLDTTAMKLYVSQDSNPGYDSADLALATVSLALDFTTADTTYTDGLQLVAGDKGNIVVKVTREGETNPIATQVVTVNIPAPAAQ